MPKRSKEKGEGIFFVCIELGVKQPSPKAGKAQHQEHEIS